MSQMIESFMNGDAATSDARARAVVLEDVGDGSDAGAAISLKSNPLHAVKVRLEARVGEASITIGQLLAARENEVLPLDRRVDHPIDLLVEGKVVARGQLVAVEDRFAVRITELPAPLAL